MADPVNPFNPAELEKNKEFFLPQKRKGFPTAGELEAERSGLASFLGTPDYTKQLTDAQDLGRLQLALAMAQRGFAAAGAAPKRGESPLGTLSRELFSPLAGDAGTVAAQVMKQKQALNAAQRQEDRQLKLAALQNVQKRREQAYADEAAATQQARQFILMSQKKDAEVSNAFTVRGDDGKFSRQPVIVEKDWLGNIIYKNASGDKIPDNKIGIYTKPNVIKPSIKQVTGIEALVIDPNGKQSWQPVPATLTTTFNNDGSVNTSELKESTTHTRLITSGENQNARKAPKAGSTNSPYYAPKEQTVFLNKTAVEVFGLGPDWVNQKATFREYLVRPDMEGPDIRPIKELVVAGRSFRFDWHRGYNPETGNITVERGPDEPPVIYEATQLFRAEDPKDFTPVGKFTIPIGDRLAQIQKIPGLGGITAGEELKLERNSAGVERIRRGNQTIKLTAEQAQLFQTRELYPTEKIKAGMEPTIWTSRGDLVVPKKNVEDIQKITGLSGITTGGKVQIEEDKLGNWRFRHGNQTIKLTAAQAQLFQTSDLSTTEKIKAGLEPTTWTPKSEFVAPSGNLLAQIQKIPGLSGITAGDTVQIEEDKLGNWRILYGNQTIKLTPKQLNLFQTGPLSETQQVEAGQVVEPRTAFVNTSNRTLQIGDQTVGAGQIGYFTKTDQASNAFMNVASSFRKVGDVSTDAVTYMFKEPRTIDGTTYVPGDEIRFSPQAFGNLSDDVKKALTNDPALRARTIKKNYFEAIWKTVSEQEQLPVKKPTEEELGSLLGMFPAGMRSGGKNLRDEIFSMIKYGTPPDAIVNAKVTSADKRKHSYEESVANELDAARNRYEHFVARGALQNRAWNSLNFEEQRAFADVKEVVQLRNVPGLWDKSKEKLKTNKQSYKNLNYGDVASYAAVSELLILAKYLKNNQDIDNTGRFFGWFGGLQANLFADIDPITSGGTQRLQSVINAMKSRYATLAGQEGEGRPSDFRLRLQEELIPAFTKAESLNRRNLDIMIQRLETSLKSVFTPEILSTTVIPRSFEKMAAEAGVVGKTDPRRYRWVDPSVPGPVPVTRESILSGVLGVAPLMFGDVQSLKVGQRLPRSSEGKVYVKIKNLSDGTVVVKEALRDGRPDPDAPEVILTEDNFRK